MNRQDRCVTPTRVSQDLVKVHMKNMESSIVLESEITCPECGHKKVETMPTDACQFFYECGQCGTILRPKPGDCCVYCSYGSVKCPSLQIKDNVSGEKEEKCC